jgi:hypothetical protein
MQYCHINTVWHTVGTAAGQASGSGNHSIYIYQPSALARKREILEILSVFAV